MDSIHRKVGHVDDRVGLVEDVVEDLALSRRSPGCPSRRADGLQVKGPAKRGHPDPRPPAPGFELGSLVLKLLFLPDEEQTAESAPAAGLAPLSMPVAPPPAPAGDRPSDRLGDAIQLVYSEESAFRTGGEGLGVTRPAEVVERDTSLL